MSSPLGLPIARLFPHPANPRLSPRMDVIEAICARLSDGFDPAHALIVRPFGDGWQILSGHHRVEAARRAGLATVPCWVRDLDDEAAYMTLATSNAQGELTALERGLHALHSGMSVREYAKKAGQSPTWTEYQRQAAEVFTQVNSDGDLSEKTKHLVEIHAAPSWLWPALVKAMLADKWTVEETRRQVARSL